MLLRIGPVALHTAAALAQEAGGEGLPAWRKDWWPLLEEYFQRFDSSGWEPAAAEVLVGWGWSYTRFGISMTDAYTGYDRVYRYQKSQWSAPVERDLAHDSACWNPADPDYLLRRSRTLRGYPGSAVFLILNFVGVREEGAYREQ